ncbi:MAG: hypothetical protein NTZ87_03385 [Candidatus Nomurabacteria bacterium]|nr:hypothetical protein [Candidatus Nomurabacteria bacterium]
MSIQLPAVLLNINRRTDEALVRFNTGVTQVVEVDDTLRFREVWVLYRQACREHWQVIVEYELGDESLRGTIVYLITPEENAQGRC